MTRPLLAALMFFAGCVIAASPKLYDDSELRGRIEVLEARCQGFENLDNALMFDQRLNTAEGKIQCLQWQHPGIEGCVPEIGAPEIPVGLGLGAGLGCLVMLKRWRK